MPAVAGRSVKILWAGPIQPPAAMLASAAPHPATMRWQQTFLKGLREAGADVRRMGHSPHRTWPWGPLRVSQTPREELAGFDRQAEDIAYLNISRVRDLSLRRAYRNAVARAIAAERPDVVVSYNADASMQGAADAATSIGVPWVPIVLDFSDPRPDDWRAFRKATARAAGVAFVSHWASRNAPVTNGHLVSGAVCRRTHAGRCGPAEGTTVVFSGSRTRATGIDRLLAAVPLIRTPGVRLVMTGHGRPDFTPADASGSHVAVVDMGMLSEGDLADVLSAATVLVNPRPLESQDSCMNFPSKVLDYLAYERPIISTRAAGIGPEYDDVLVFSESDSPAAIAAAIDDVLGWPRSRQAEAVDRIREFNTRATPRASALRFITWLETVCDSTRLPS